MAGSINKVILVGNLGRDPEVRRMNNGDPVVNLSVATSESWRKASCSCVTLVSSSCSRCAAERSSRMCDRASS